MADYCNTREMPTLRIQQLERRFITKDEFTKLKFEFSQDDERSKVTSDLTKQIRSLSQKITEFETIMGNNETEFGTIRMELRSRASITKVEQMEL